MSLSDKILWNWEMLEKKGPLVLFEELSNMKAICADVQKSIRAYGENYEKYYDMAFKEDLPRSYDNISNFLSSVKSLSKEAYDFLTEDRDVIDLKDYFKLEGLSLEKKMATVTLQTEFVDYLAYSFTKLCRIEDKEMKKTFLNGLFGIS